MSEAEQSIRVSGHPTLVKTQDVTATAGAGAVINMDGAMDPPFLYLMEICSGTNINSIVDMIQVHIEMFLRSTHLGAIMAARGLSVKSGVALATEFDMLNTRLGDKAAKLEQTEWNIWALFFKWNNQQQMKISILSIKSHLICVMNTQTLKLLNEALQIGVASPETFVKELHISKIAKIVITDGDTLETIFERDR